MIRSPRIPFERALWHARNLIEPADTLLGVPGTDLRLRQELRQRRLTIAHMALHARSDSERLFRRLEGQHKALSAVLDEQIAALRKERRA